MKVLHILDHSLPIYSVYSVRSHNILKFQNMEVEVLTSPKQAEHNNEDYTIDNISYGRTSFNPKNPLQKISYTKELYFMQRVEACLKDRFCEELPDIVHAHSPLLNLWPAYMYARANNLPVVYEVRAFWEDAAVERGMTKENSLRYNLSKKLETLLMNRADQIVTLSEPMREEIITRGIDRSKVHIVPNAVDAIQYATRKPKKVLLKKYNLNNSRVIGFIGSFYHYEGLDLLIKAYKLISQNRKNVKLLLVGDGDDRKILEKMAANFDLRDPIIFTGEIDYEEMLDYYSVLDIAVFPRKKLRLTELVCPFKLIEAMATSTPVVGSNVGGIREYIDDGITGLLANTDDYCDLAQKIETLLTNSSLYGKLREEGRKAVLKRWNWPTVVRKYQEIYNLTLDNRYA